MPEPRRGDGEPKNVGATADYARPAISLSRTSISQGPPSSGSAKYNTLLWRLTSVTIHIPG